MSQKKTLTAPVRPGSPAPPTAAAVLASGLPSRSGETPLAQPVPAVPAAPARLGHRLADLSLTTLVRRNPAALHQPAAISRVAPSPTGEGAVLQRQPVSRPVTGSVIQLGRKSGRGNGKAFFQSGKAKRKAAHYQQQAQKKFESRPLTAPKQAEGPLFNELGTTGTLLMLLMIAGSLPTVGATPTGPQRNSSGAAKEQLPPPPSRGLLAPPQGNTTNSTALTLPSRGGISGNQTAIPVPPFGGFSFGVGNSTQNRTTPVGSSAVARRPSTALTSVGSRQVARRDQTALTPVPPSQVARDNQTTTVSPTVTPPKPTASRPVRPPEPPTTINQKGEVVFGNQADQERFQDPIKRPGVETKAIKHLLNSTQTGAGVLKGLEQVDTNPLVVRTDLGARAAGEASMSSNKHVKVHSGYNYVKNAITAAHEFKHLEQFGLGQVEENSNPYRKAAAEIEAKITGVNTYRELRDQGYIPKLDKHTQSEEFDLKDYEKNPQAYKRQVFRTYHNLYLEQEIARSKKEFKDYKAGKADYPQHAAKYSKFKSEREVEKDLRAKYPAFKSDKELDTHIQAQEEYFQARKNLAQVEAKIKKQKLNLENPQSLPTDVREELQAARAANRAAKRKTERK